MSAPKNIHQRIAAVMASVTYIQKEKKKEMNYSIVSHDAVTAKVRPALLDNGIVYYPVRCEHSHNGNRAECSMTVRFANIDEPADFIDVQSFGYGVDTQDKGPGKAMSYAVKYALLKTLGLETGDDADHDSLPYEPADPHQRAEPPKASASDAEVFAAIDAIDATKTIPDLVAWWKGLNANARHVAEHPDVIKAKDARKAALSERKAA